MRKRPMDDSDVEPPKKKPNLTGHHGIKRGEILTDIAGKQWRLGKVIGQGGFGEIFLVSDNINEDVGYNAPYVAKIESHFNGPLFVEINCYLRMAKMNMIKEWKEQRKLDHLGVPHYVSSGSHKAGDNKYRFLILPRFETDLEVIFASKRNKINLKTVLTIACQIIDILEYIHDKGFVHSDIKASNILLKCRKTQPKPLTPIKKTCVRYYGTGPMRTCRARKLQVPRTLRENGNLKYIDNPVEDEKPPTQYGQDQVYLLDYGLACKYIKDSKHIPYERDERRAHAGTILYCSLDAHIGTQSRRSDLECLGYNMVFWLTGSLPWAEDADNPEVVERKKKSCLYDLKAFLSCCFTDYPKFLYEYFKYLLTLNFEDKPDYNFIRDLFQQALKDYGYKTNNLFDFDNLEGWGRKQKKIKKKSENLNLSSVVRRRWSRIPLHSNLPIKPVLRKKLKNKKVRQLNWSSILLDDPEVILKQAKNRERKHTDSGDTNGCLHLDLQKMRPTYHMINVYNRYMEKINSGSGASPTYAQESSSESIEGYTAPMMEIMMKKKEKEELEQQKTQRRSNKKRSKLRVDTSFSPRRTRGAKDLKVKYRLRG